MSRSRTPAGAPLRWRRWLFLLALPALVAVYAAAGFLLVPWFAQRELPRYFDARLQLAARVESIAFNPFTLRARLSGFAASERNGSPVLTVDAARVGLRWRSLIERAPVVEELHLAAPSLRIRVAEDGRVNLAEIAARMGHAERAPAPDRDAEPPRLSIERAAIENGHIAIDDAQAGFRESFTDLEVQVNALTTLERRDGSVRLAARSAGGAQITWNGRISALTPELTGTLTVKSLTLAPFSPYAVRHAGMRVAGQLAELRLPHRISIESGAARVGAENAMLALNGLALESDAGELPALRVAALALEDVAADSAARTVSAKSLQIGGLSAAGREVDGARATAGEIRIAGLGFDLASKQAVLESLDAETIELVARAGEPPLARVESAGARGLRAALAGREIALEAATVARAHFAVRRDASGGIDFGAWPMRAAAAPAAPDSGPGWTIAAAKVELRDVSGVYQDATAKRPVEMRIGPLASRLALRVAPGKSGTAITAEVGESRVGEIAAREIGTGEPALRLTDVSLASARFDSTAPVLSLGALQVATLGAKIETDGGRVALLDLVPDTGPPAGAPLALKLASAEVRSMDLSYADRASRAGASLPGGKLSLSALSVNGASAAAARVSFAGKELKFSDPGSALDVRLGDVALEASGVSTQKESVLGASVQLALGTLSYSDGRAGRTVNATRLAFKAARLSAAGARIAADHAELSGADADYAERDTGFALGLVAPRATLAGLSSEGKRPTEFGIAAGLKAGGRFAARGSAVFANRTLDARIEGSEIALAQLEPLLRPHANVRIGSGLAAVSGQLTVGGSSRMTFDGGALIANLSLLDAEREPIVRWKALETPAMKITLEPFQVRLGELRWDEPEGRVRVNADGSINVGRVLVRGETGGQKSAASAKDRSTPLSLGIGRIRVSGAKLDFADDSVTPGFITRIHSLGGTINGLSTDHDTRGRFSLEGEVDESGHALVSGTINPFFLRDGTRLRMQLRGLDVARISPYAMKFAGYRIAAGTVSLDLKYRIDGGDISGDNQIVLDEFTLGERVESPDALDLPIELAIALLRDPDGRIDVALKVHGNLDDPKFDYGEIVGKALGNLVTGIVAAPFRLLAGLLGGNGDEFGVVRFDPGSSRLLPRERAKLAKVAQALAQRPDLKIRVPARYDAEVDARALRADALRREVARRAGLEVDEESDPGPLTPDDRPTRQALQALFSERFGKAELDRLGVGAPAATAGESAAPDKLPAPGAGKQNAVAFDALVARLRETQPLAERALETLAARRAQAIGNALGSAGVETARIEIGTADSLRAADAEQVTIELALMAK